MSLYWGIEMFDIKIPMTIDYCYFVVVVVVSACMFLCTSAFFPYFDFFVLGSFPVFS